MMQAYTPKYESLLRMTGTARSQLDESLQDLIHKFENAHKVIENAEPRQYGKLLNVLIRVDAIICSKLYQLFRVSPERQEHSEDTVRNIDKARVMALKAKALQIKWKNREVEKVRV